MTQVTLNNGSVDSAGSLKLRTNGTTDALILDTAQNVGVGVTPSAWGGPFKAIQSGNGGSAVGFQTNANVMRLFVNNFYNGTNYVYTGSAAASQYTCNSDGSFNWQIAASGTAGNAITFTQAMTLNATGALLVACTAVPINGVDGAWISAPTAGSGILLGSSSTSTTQMIRFYNPNGNIGGISSSGSATAYATSSDYRLKENIAPMTGALAKVSALKPVTYTWKIDGSEGEGFIAHELAEVAPHAVIGVKDATEMQQYEISPAVPATYDEEGNELTPAVEAVIGEREVPKYQGIDTSFLVATLTAAIQELNAKVVALEAQLQNN